MNVTSLRMELLNKNEIRSLTVIFVDCQLWNPMAPWLLLAGSRGPANCKVFLLGGGDLDLKNIKNMNENFEKNC